jgi:hypothetical protein
MLQNFQFPCRDFEKLSFSEYPNAYLSAFQNPQKCLGKDSQLF